MEYVYGALLLHKVGKDINDENLHKVLTATGSHVDESKVKTLVASLKGVDIDKELANAALVSAAPAHAEAKKEEKKEEKKDASAAAEGLSALFG